MAGPLPRSALEAEWFPFESKSPTVALVEQGGDLSLCASMRPRYLSAGREAREARYETPFQGAV